jgi:hypothetical protein
MFSNHRPILAVFGGLSLVLLLSACSFKATFKETTDTTSNITGTHIRTHLVERRWPAEIRTQGCGLHRLQCGQSSSRYGPRTRRVPGLVGPPDGRLPRIGISTVRAGFIRSMDPVR